MTPEAQRKAIAEACGWTDIAVTQRLWFGCWENEPFKRVIPDYLDDLNVIREAVMLLREHKPLKYIKYVAELTKVIAKFNSDLEDRWSISAYDASAPQRGEAFLKAIGKWEDEPKAA